MPTRHSSAPPPVGPAHQPEASDRGRPPTGTTPPRPSQSTSARTPVKRTRAGAAWVGIAVGAAVLVLLIVFMLQNTTPVEVAFFNLRGTAPLSAVLLIAGVGFAAVALVIGSLRIGQLRRRVGSGGPGGGRR